MVNILEEARMIREELIRNRRYLHQNAELGFALPKTKAYLLKELRAYGYDPQIVGEGIVCLCGGGGRTIMLRADMDALPQKEVTGLDFASQEEACHSCGHDGHMAVMLGAAKLLKEHEKELMGTVKIIFQPGEELLSGSRKMIEAGVLENPKVDAAMAFHLGFGPSELYENTVGRLAYSPHKMLPSADAFEITVKGKSAHGSAPYAGISALNAAANIIVAVQQLLCLEVPCTEPSVISICRLTSGASSNIIPDEAVMQGSIRAYTRENRQFLKERLAEISQNIGINWRTEISVVFTHGVGPTINDPQLSEELAAYCGEVMKEVTVIPQLAYSEDFSNYGEYVPAFFASLCAGRPEEGYAFSLHDPAAVFDEEALVYGAAAFSNAAMKWLENHPI